MRFIQEVANKIGSKNHKDKYEAEVSFWIDVQREYIKWYLGELADLYGTKPPKEDEKVRARNLKDSAILTWFKLHQQPKYLHDLALDRDAFAGLRLLDIGAGAMPSALCFDNCDLYCLDPLYHKYLEAGFPFHYYGAVKFVYAFAEDIPLDDDFVDAVISVNAIDHVDNLEKTSLEIKRVLKEGGKLAMHVHYHKATVTEPIEINDAIFQELFSWCRGLRKISESQSKMGWDLKDANEKYTLWKNF